MRTHDICHDRFCNRPHRVRPPSRTAGPLPRPDAAQYLARDAVGAHTPTSLGRPSPWAGAAQGAENDFPATAQPPSGRLSIDHTRRPTTRDHHEYLVEHCVSRVVPQDFSAHPMFQKDVSTRGGAQARGRQRLHGSVGWSQLAATGG
jgi:hypothetical protein